MANIHLCHIITTKKEFKSSVPSGPKGSKEPLEANRKLELLTWDAPLTILQAETAIQALFIPLLIDNNMFESRQHMPKMFISMCKQKPKQLLVDNYFDKNNLALHFCMLY